MWGIRFVGVTKLRDEVAVEVDARGCISYRGFAAHAR